MTNRVGGGDAMQDLRGYFSAPTMTCGCPACGLANAADAPSSPHVRTSVTSAPADDNRSYAVLPQYRNADGSWSFTGDRNIDAVLIGTKITSTELTYTFPTRGSDYGSAYDNAQQVGLLAFNDLQQDAARKAFAMVASYTNLSFREITPEESLVDRATFRLAQTMSDSVGSAMGNFPLTAQPLVGQNPSGDIWFGRTQQPYYTNPEKGNWGYVTMLHEIGHTLGLKHGGDDYTQFNLAELFDVSGPLFGTRALEWEKDGQLWSLMTYSVGPDTRNVFNGDAQNQATSYMMYDIAALQYLYGANYATNSGDTVYRWSETTGEGFVNGVGQGRPAGNKVLETIWDGGGVDTYDLSNYADGVSVDLRPGATSILSRAQLANAEAYFGFDAPMQGSVGNALLHGGDTRSLIENAIGGAGDDRIAGNQADNVLTGNAGDDLFDGREGSDLILGGDGSDTVFFSTATSGITVSLNDGSGDIRVANGRDVDTLRSIENVSGTAHDDVLVGDRGDNMLAGGSGGDDILVGGDGNDRLIGGGFELFRPDLPDVLKGEDRANGSIDTAISLDGSFDLAPRYGVADASTIPHATVVAKVAAEGYEYYSFTGTAGAVVTLDIDLEGSSFPPGLLLLDASGKLLSENYEHLKRDQGSRLASEPALTFTLPADGVYFAVVTSSAIRGASYIPVEMQPGLAYTLHLSVERADTPAPALVRTATATLDGGAGDDLLVTTMGDDVVRGGSGRDTVSFEQSFRGIAVDLGVTTAQDTGAGIDRISGVENVTGSRHADRIVGDAGDNRIDGVTGNDTLLGGAGTDTISFERQALGVTFALAAQDAAQTVRLGERVTASGFENVTGSAFADRLSGDAGANVIDGGAGDDILSGDSLGRAGEADLLIGGSGTDTASFASAAAAVIAHLSADGAGLATMAGATVATLRGIENLEGGSGADWLRGDADANRLDGGAGNDRLEGRGGDDLLAGAAGDDVLNGGDGSDTAAYGADATVDLRLVGPQDTGHGRDTLRSIENVRLSGGANRVIGNAGDNVVQDGGGDDVVDGGAGSDTMDYSAALQRVTVDLTLATAQATGAGSDRLSGIENLVGGAFGNRFFGDAGINRLVGGSGVDTLIGGSGEDRLFGGAGDDTLIGDGLRLGDLSHDGQGDHLDGGDGSDVLIGGQGDDTLIGGSGNDALFGGTVNVDLLPSGRMFEWQRVDSGNDVLDGGEGIDRAILHFVGRNEMMALDLSDSKAISYLYADGVAVGSVTGIERLDIVAGNGGSHFVGTAGYDALWGGLGNDTLIGGLGNDELTGDEGDDYIDGGEGFDILGFSTLTNIANGITVDLRITGAQNTGAGWDTILNIEQIVSTRFSDKVIGGDENLSVFDGLGGDDTLIGNGGNDTLWINRYPTYEGGPSTIMLDGGEGQDRLFYAGGFVPDRTTAEGDLPQHDIVTAIGGDGDDFITTSGALRTTIDAGAGNDVVGISIAGTRAIAYDIRLGTGSDELAIQWGNADLASFARDTIVVRDFKAGFGADRLGLTAIVGQALFMADGSEELLDTFSPFLSGHVTLVKSGRDTLLQVDKDGRFGSDHAMVTVMRLENTAAFDFVTGNVYAYIPRGLSQETVLYTPIITQYMGVGETSLDGHAGRDSLVGAAGNDVLTGQAGADFLYGFDGDDMLIGGAGDDYMVGGAGDDIYHVDSAADYVQEQADEGTDVVVTSVDWTLGDEFEVIVSAGGAIRAAGNWRDNVLAGSETGGETLIGDYGDDTYVIAHSGTTIVEDQYAGKDVVVVMARSYTLSETAWVELMQAATGTDAIDLTGNEFDQMLVANGGANRLDGRGGFDVVSYRDAAAGVTVDGRTMTGTKGDAFGDSYVAVEGFQGSDFDDRLFAGGTATTLDGGAGDDWLASGAGNDLLYGGAGRDVFAFDTSGISGRDTVRDWSAGDLLAVSKQLRGADTAGKVTLASTGVVLLDGSQRGDIAELAGQGGAKLQALGKADGFWWYAFVSGADASHVDGRVTELANVDTGGAAAGPLAQGVGHDAGASAAGHASASNSPFYLYDVMGDAMASGVVLSA